MNITSYFYVFDSISLFSFLQQAAEDDAVPSTTGVTRVSVTPAACLMTSAAETMNLSAPQVSRNSS